MLIANPDISNVRLGERSDGVIGRRDGKGAGWTVWGAEIHHSGSEVGTYGPDNKQAFQGVGVSMGKQWKLLHSNIHHMMQHAYSGGMVDGEVAHNWIHHGLHGTGDAGLNKTVGSRRALVRHNYLSDSPTNGVWFDGPVNCNCDWIWEYNLAENLGRSGYDAEICCGGIVRYNLAINCGTGDSSRAGFVDLNSPNVKMHGNRAENCPTGFLVRSDNRINPNAATTCEYSLDRVEVYENEAVDCAVPAKIAVGVAQRDNSWN